MADISSAVSATSRPIGPSTEIGAQPNGRRSEGTRPGEGRWPTTPQKAAGRRRLPPVSDPVAIGTMPAARAAADPPDEPPPVRVASKGLPVAPSPGVGELPPAPTTGTLGK